MKVGLVTRVSPFLIMRLSICLTVGWLASTSIWIVLSSVVVLSAVSLLPVSGCLLQLLCADRCVVTVVHAGLACDVVGLSDMRMMLLVVLTLMSVVRLRVLVLTMRPLAV